MFIGYEHKNLEEKTQSFILAGFFKRFRNISIEIATQYALDNPNTQFVLDFRKKLAK